VTVFVFALAAIALIASVVAVGFGLRAIDESEGSISAGGAGAALTEQVTLADFSIDPGSITASGRITVANEGGSGHNLVVEGTDARTETFNSGESVELSLAGVAPGTYTAFCDIPGHREAGMEAQLTVVEGGAGEVAAEGEADHGAATHERMSADEMDEVMHAVVEKFPAKTEGLGAQDLAPTVLADGTKQFELTVEEIKWELEPGKFVDAMAYNGQVPGPTMRVDPGDKVRFVLKNEMKESTAVHFHGVDIPNALDGVPDITQPPIKPGASFVYEWTTQTTPAVGMYHSHHNAQVQVPNGLFGALLIGKVPTAGPAPTDEQVMILNDAGTIGFSLNGKSFPATTPYVAKVGDRILLHYMNEGVMAHPMHLHGMPQLVVAKDGFPLDSPYLADTINVSPGERYTVLIDVKVPGVWAWHCHILPHAERSTGMFGMVTALIAE
jgi:FtsP/CotA-like multicopper oxidase with cupredoxin domain